MTRVTGRNPNYFAFLLVVWVLTFSSFYMNGAVAEETRKTLVFDVAEVLGEDSAIVYNVTIMYHHYDKFRDLNIREWMWFLLRIETKQVDKDWVTITKYSRATTAQKDYLRKISEMIPFARVYLEEGNVRIERHTGTYENGTHSLLVYHHINLVRNVSYVTYLPYEHDPPRWSVLSDLNTTLNPKSEYLTGLNVSYQVLYFANILEYVSMIRGENTTRYYVAFVATPKAGVKTYKHVTKGNHEIEVYAGGNSHVFIDNYTGVMSYDAIISYSEKFTENNTMYFRYTGYVSAFPIYMENVVKDPYVYAYVRIAEPLTTTMFTSYQKIHETLIILASLVVTIANKKRKNIPSNK